MKKPLEQKVALITGAASGIGRATALRMHELGASLCLVDASEAPLQLLAESLAGRERVLYRALDVTDEQATIAVLEAVAARFGRLDIMHLNAGILQLGTLREMTLDSWRRTLEVNLTGVFLGIKHGEVLMRETGGSIVVTASGSGLFGSHGMAAYTASKHGVIGLVKSAAIELAPQGIRVNAIAPGAVHTNMMVVKGSLEEVNASPLARSIVMNRIGEAHEVAELVCFLAGPQSSYITGGVFPVDGGVSATGIPIARSGGPQ